jgi:hypothetical protein
MFPWEDKSAKPTALEVFCSQSRGGNDLANGPEGTRLQAPDGQPHGAARAGPQRTRCPGRAILQATLSDLICDRSNGRQKAAVQSLSRSPGTGVTGRGDRA